MPGPGLLYTERILVVVQAFALGALIVRFAASHLHRKYPGFFWYLLVLASQLLLVPLFVKRTTTLYGYAFMATEAVIVCFYALILMELYSMVLGDLPGLASVSRRYIQIALGLALGVSLLITELEVVSSNLLAQFFVFERTIVSSILCFLLLITAFLVYYPVRLSRNVVYYSIGYAIYFTSKSTTLLIRNTGHQWDAWLGAAMLAISTICLIFWTVSLSEAGERTTMVLGARANPADNERVLQQLRSINASLIRARK